MKYGTSVEPVREKYNADVIRYITSACFKNNIGGFGSIEAKIQLLVYVETILLKAV